LTDLKQTVAELEQRLQASFAERDRLLLQQAATSEILKEFSRQSGTGVRHHSGKGEWRVLH
jgi:hypothetical protein